MGRGLAREMRRSMIGPAGLNLKRALSLRVGPAHATVPNSAPTPAVSAMASAPQNVTRYLTHCHSCSACACSQPS